MENRNVFKYFLVSEIMIRAVRFIEGPYIPSAEGATNHFLNFCRYTYKKGLDIRVFHCFRGWSNIDEMKKEDYPIYLFHPDTYYKNIDLLCSILKKEKINLLIMNDAEVVYYHGSLIKKRIPDIKIFFEIHDVETTLKKKLNKANKYDITVERKALEIADFYSCFTNKDRKELLKLGARKNDLYVVPSAVDLTNIHYNGPSDKEAVLFLGNNYYEPNVIAIKEISEIIADKIKCPVIIGGNYPKSLEKYKNLSFLGFFENLNDLLKKATIAIAPIKIGSGIRIKTLNYMASGIPVISTSVGIEGIKRGKGVIICNKLENYPEIINNLLDNKKALKEMGESNRKIIERYYSWDLISEKLIKLFNKYVK